MKMDVRCKTKKRNNFSFENVCHEINKSKKRLDLTVN